MLSPCVKHRSSDAEDSTATSQVCYEFTLNVIKCTLDCVEHTCCGGGDNEYKICAVTRSTDRHCYRHTCNMSTGWILLKKDFWLFKCVHLLQTAF